MNVVQKAARYIGGYESLARARDPLRHVGTKLIFMFAYRSPPLRRRAGYAREIEGTRAKRVRGSDVNNTHAGPVEISSGGWKIARRASSSSSSTPQILYNDLARAINSSGLSGFVHYSVSRVVSLSLSRPNVNNTGIRKRAAKETRRA